MKILKIEAQRFRKDRRSVFFDGRDPVNLHEETVARFALSEGKDLSEAQISEIISESQRKEAGDYAYQLLNYRSLSEAAMRDKLKRRKFGPKVVDKVVAALKEQNLINDEEFAKGAAEARLKGKKVGDFKVKQDLVRRGISKEMAEEAIKKAQEQPGGGIPSEDDRAYAALLKRRSQIKAIDDRTLYRRLFEYLARRGFDPDTVNRALQRYKREGGLPDPLEEY